MAVLPANNRKPSENGPGLSGGLQRVWREYGLIPKRSGSANRMEHPRTLSPTTAIASASGPAFHL
jgi:hypothetical protein